MPFFSDPDGGHVHAGCPLDCTGESVPAPPYAHGPNAVKDAEAAWVETYAAHYGVTEEAARAVYLGKSFADPRGPIHRELRHVCGCPCRCEFECAFGVRCPTAHGDPPPFVE